MQESLDVVGLLRRRARMLENVARHSTAVLGGDLLEVNVEPFDAAEPAVWIRNEVLVTFRIDEIVVGRIAGNMTDVDEVARFPADAVLDAAKFAVMDAVGRAVGFQIERMMMDRGMET